MKILFYFYIILNLFWILVDDGYCQSTAETDSYQEIFIHSGLPWQSFASSAEQRQIFKLELGSGKNVILIMAGMHGDEHIGAELVMRFSVYAYDSLQLDSTKRVILIPIMNPDGYIKNQRTNANGVDINRNFPTSNWTSKYQTKRYFPGKYPASEPETRAAIDLIRESNPAKIITVHSPLETVNYDGPALNLARIISKLTGYPLKEYIGYPTKGSFGTYAGKELGIPTITLELPNASLANVWKGNCTALIEAINYEPNGF